MKNYKRLLALTLALVMAISCGTMSFASSYKKTKSVFHYNYWAKQYTHTSTGDILWKIKIPGHNTLSLDTNRKNSRRFYSALVDVDEYYDSFKRLAKPSSSLKQTNPKLYQEKYARYQCIRKTFSDLRANCDEYTLNSERKLRKALTQCNKQHYSSYNFDFENVDATKGTDGLYEIIRASDRLAYAIDRYYILADY